MSGILKRTMFGSAVVLAGVGCVGGHRQYQRHISAEVKRTLTAAMDTSATVAEDLEYINNARLQARTRKDSEVIQRFEKAVRYAQIADELMNQATVSLSATLQGRVHLEQAVFDDDVERAKENGDTADRLFESIRPDLGLPPSHNMNLERPSRTL